MFIPTLNPALRNFWTADGIRNRILYGGRSSSKLWDAAGFAIFLATQGKIKFLCARQFQNKISESVYTLLKVQIERFGWSSEFEVLRDRITHKKTGSQFIFYGLWRHIDEIKSLEGIDICWIEEAHNLTQEQWDILEPTLRGNASQFWIIFNPRLITDFVWRRFIKNPPPKTISRQINYTENPFLSQTILDVIAAKKEEDEDDYRHIYLGEPLEDDDQVIIKRSWIMAAIDAHKKLSIEPFGRKRIGFDVADSGNDKCALVAAHGIVAIQCEEWKAGEDELLKSAGRVHALAVRSGSEIDYDSIGIGAFAGAHFQALNAMQETVVAYHKFNAGGEVLNKARRIDCKDDKSPKNGEFYTNLKAQAWWEIGMRFRNTYNAIKNGEQFSEDQLISISSDCAHLDGLVDELAMPRKDFDNHGKSKVESKKDLAARDIPSPNKADAFIMAYAPRSTSGTAYQQEIAGLY
jgi:phage terminase large subunit